MRKKIIVSCCLMFIIGIVVFQFIPKQETITVQDEYAIKSKIELINDASVIIRGTVKEILPSKWSNPDFIKGEDVRNIIQTDVLVMVEDKYKGVLYDEKEVIVRINKGEIEDIKMISDGYPDFILGEEVVLFLSKDSGDLADIKENYYVLTGMLQGKFSLMESNDIDRIFNNYNNEDTFNLSTIREEIETSLEYLQNNPLTKMTEEEIRIQNEKMFKN